MTPKGGHRHAVIAMVSFADATKEAKEGAGNNGVKRNGRDRQQFAERRAFK